MSHDEDGGSWIREQLGYWFGFPEPGKNHEDNIWHDFHIFNNEWIDLQVHKEWYESPNVPSIYADHKNIMKQNMQMNRPEEDFYAQHMGNGDFKSIMFCDEELPSGKGHVRINTRIDTKNAPSGENNFAMVEYLVTTRIKYKMPKGVDFLPRILAKPLNQFFKKVFLLYIGEEMVERDGEYARERTTEYFQYIRKYHGEEPKQTRTRQAEFKPVPEEGIFFQ